MTTEVWANALEFLHKTPLQGNEAPAFNNVLQGVAGIVQGQLQIIPTEELEILSKAYQFIEKNGGQDAVEKALSGKDMSVPKDPPSKKT